MQCSHCGREVKETRHTQKGYRVDYYLLHTGRTERTFFKDPKEDMPLVYYLKLVQPMDIVSCRDCYGNPQIRSRLDDDFNDLSSILDDREIGTPSKKAGSGPDND